jgi:hypothetical protein
MFETRYSTGVALVASNTIHCTSLDFAIKLSLFSIDLDNYTERKVSTTPGFLWQIVTATQYARPSMVL